MDIAQFSFREISEAVKAKKISAAEVTRIYLERAKKLDPQLNSIICYADAAAQDAQAIDQKIARGEEVGPLAGVPFGIKDMFCTKGLQTTAGSKILKGFIPPYDATAVARLKRAGAVVSCKLNLDEFAMGSSNETSAFGPVKNPWNLEHVPGGSSGGSAAAQAARLVAGTVGTDTGGSIRQPASFCGIVGVKPTYGRVSRYGIVSYASSLDQAGPMVSSVADAAIALEVMSGHDERDSTSSSKKVPSFSKDLKPSVKGLKIGLLKEYMAGGVHSDVQKVMDQSIQELKKMGAAFVDVSVPLTQYAVPIYYLIATSEASSNLARYDGVKYGLRAPMKDFSETSLDEFYAQTRGLGFGTEVKRRIMLGTYCLSSGYYDAYYNKACQVRRMLKDQFVQAFSQCDAILSPVSTHPAFKLGERISDPLAMYLNDIFTVSTNLTGLPGLSVPFGMANGLPVGVQLTSRHFDEQTILNIAASLESVSNLKGEKPHVI